MTVLQSEAESNLAKKMIIFFTLLSKKATEDSDNILEIANVRLFWKLAVTVKNGCIFADKELSLWGKLNLEDKNFDFKNFDFRNHLTDCQIESFGHLVGGLTKAKEYVSDMHKQWHRFISVSKPLNVRGRNGFPFSNVLAYEAEDETKRLERFCFCAETEADGIQISKSTAQFNGGYLVVEDEGYESDLAALGLKHDGANAGVSEAVQVAVEEINRNNADFDLGLDSIVRLFNAAVGRNIYLEAEYETGEEAIGNPTIFLFCQDDKVDGQENKTENSGDCSHCDKDSNIVELKESFDNEYRQIEWRISEEGSNKKEFLTGDHGNKSVAFAGQHLVVINQDKDLIVEELKRLEEDGAIDQEVANALNLQPYFEINIDAMPLNVINKYTTGKFPMPNGPICFFIGYNPYAANPDETLFKGKLKRIVFDPNSTCAGCPTGD